MADLNAVQWGAVSDWVAGIATVVAVVVAFWFSLRADRQQESERVAHVFAWMTMHADGGLVLSVSNGTAAPIYDWTVEATWLDEASERTTLTTGSGEFGLLPPGRYEFPLRNDAPVGRPRVDSAIEISLTFTDGAGRRRMRHPNGRLTRG